MLFFNQYQKRFFLAIFFIFFLQVIFFSFLEKLFLYKSVEDQFLQLKFYITNLLIISVFFVFFFKSKKNQINLIFPKFNSKNEFLFYLNIIVLVSSVFYLVCKLIIIYYGYISEPNNQFFLDCLLIKVRSYYLINLKKSHRSNQ